jgi:hypothetical protein
LKNEDILLSFQEQITRLSDLLSRDDLWYMEEPSVSNEQQDFNLFDVFEHFKATSPDALIPDDSKAYFYFLKKLISLLFSAVDLWKSLRVIEETNALQFRWMSSRFYSRFVKALCLHNTLLYPPVSTSITEEQIESNAEASHHQSEPLNSLSVDPVDFDWNASGLSNPLASSCKLNYSFERLKQ